jgi:Tfp pilus assembly protein PilZ
MVAPAPDSPVRLRLKCPDPEDFVARFAPNVTRGGIFLPTREARDVGASIRFELMLMDERLVLAGEGVVTWAKPKGLGVKFTSLDPATTPMLERLLSRREGGEPPPATVVAPAIVAPAAVAPASTSAPPSSTPPVSTSRPTRRPPVRPVLIAAVALGGLAIVWMSIGRAPVREAPARVEIASATVAAPAAPIAAPAPATAPAAPKEEAPPPSPPIATDSRPSAVHVDSVLVGPSYKRFTCPDPTARFSLRTAKTVNVCLQITHKPEKTDQVTLIWERNGAFYGKTAVEIPAARPNVRTRAHMRIGHSRVGSWSVRVVSARNAPLAHATFEVTP